jgi:hypothetical protein
MYNVSIRTYDLGFVVQYIQIHLCLYTYMYTVDGLLAPHATYSNTSFLCYSFSMENLYEVSRA